jgi:hypothetical protein
MVSVTEQLIIGLAALAGGLAVFLRRAALVRKLDRLAGVDAGEGRFRAAIGRWQVLGTSAFLVAVGLAATTSAIIRML